MNISYLSARWIHSTDLSCSECLEISEGKCSRNRIYLGEHRVAVDFMVELGIVATLREVVLRGVTELPWPQVAAVTGFLLALGALLRFGDLRAIEQQNSEYPVQQAGSTRRR
jgi:hypothetical protein